MSNFILVISFSNSFVLFIVRYSSWVLEVLLNILSATISSAALSLILSAKLIPRQENRSNYGNSFSLEVTIVTVERVSKSEIRYR